MSTRAWPHRTLRSSLASSALLGGALVLQGSLFGCGGADTTGVFDTGSGTGTIVGAGGQGGGGAGSGGGQGGSGGPGSGGGMTGAEDCLDGVDNDGDGDIDCADSDCNAGFTCVEEAPAGFAYALIVEDGAAPCPNGESPEELFVDPAGPAECAACSCGALEGASCAPRTLSCHTNTSFCGGGGSNWTGAFGNDASATCAKPTNLLGSALLLSCRLTGTPTVAAAGSCAPSASDLQNKEPFGSRIHACAVAAAGGGGCGAGAACAPKPAEPSESLCIRHDGEASCPAGFTTFVQSYKSATDTRACSACACESSATCSGGLYRFYDFDECGAGGDNPIAVNNNTCRNVSSLLDGSSWSIERELPTVSGSCAATGGEPSGSLTPEGPVTFCCK